jgi:eukaryotic-like serine/threonine-protein kinase
MSADLPSDPGPPPPGGDTTAVSAGVTIPDYQLLQHIGDGAFGEVCLAQSIATGRYRAVKIVRRNRLPDQRSYEIEFAGLKTFEEVSREHLGFIDILHISRHDEAGYFYYVMDLADDVEAGQQINADTYRAKTLATELAKHGRLPVSESIRIGLALAEALAELHEHGLVHQDIKPSNIVFVRGSPRLADIGLVAEASRSPHSVVMGTPAYMDAQVHGTTRGDLYSLGKILYVMASGRPAKDWPAWPTDPIPADELDDFRELDRIFRRACHSEVAARYANAEQIREALWPLRISASIRRLQAMARLFATFKRFAGVGLLLMALAALAGYQWKLRQRQIEDLHTRQVGSFVAYGTRAVDEQDLLGSLPWFAEALRLDQNNPANVATHRLRLASVLQNAPALVQMRFVERGIGYAAFAGQENQLLAPSPDGRWGILDLIGGHSIYPATFGTTNWNELPSISLTAGLALTSGDPTNAVRLWKLGTGEELPPFIYGTNLSSAVISPDGQWAAAAVEQSGILKSVLLWNVPTRQPGWVSHQHSKGILNLSFSHDGKRLTSAGEDGLVCVYETAAGRCLLRLDKHTNWVYYATFSPDDTLIATASFDRSVRVWNSLTGNESAPPIWHRDGVYSVEFSTEGSRLVTACLDFTVRVWEREKPTGRPVLSQLLRHDAKPVYAGFSPQGRHIVTATHDGTIRVWHLRPETSGKILPAKALSSDGRHYVQESNGQVQLADARDQLVLRSFPIGTRPFLKALISDRGERVLIVTGALDPSAAKQAEARGWSCRTGQADEFAVSLPVPLPELVLSPNGKRLAVLDIKTHHLAVWDLAAGRQLFQTEERVRHVAFDPLGQKLALALPGIHGVVIQHLDKGIQQRTAPLRHSLPVGSMMWDSQSRYLLTACWDYSFAADAARLWDTSTGKQASPALNHKDGVRFASFSPGDKKIVSCGEDFVAILWEPRSGRQLAPPLVHKHQVVHAAFSKDGRWLATACRDGTARVWDTETGEPITPPLPHGDELDYVQFLDGTSQLCARNTNGVYRVWRLSPDPRSVEHLAQIAEVLSSQCGNPGEIMRAATKRELSASWNKLRSLYPDDLGPEAR